MRSFMYQYDPTLVVMYLLLLLGITASAIFQVLAIIMGDEHDSD